MKPSILFSFGGFVTISVISVGAIPGNGLEQLAARLKPFDAAEMKTAITLQENDHISNVFAKILFAMNENRLSPNNAFAFLQRMSLIYRDPSRPYVVIMKGIVEAYMNYASSSKAEREQNEIIVSVRADLDSILRNKLIGLEETAGKFGDPMEKLIQKEGQDITYIVDEMISVLFKEKNVQKEIYNS